ncbi:hypothetical protein pb186bvf_009971 [Paramecium bursaria]
MLRFKSLYRIGDHLPIVDIIDYNHNIQQQKQEYKSNIKELLGPNYNKYFDTAYELKYINGLQPASETRLLNDHFSIRSQDRIFCDINNLLGVRQQESFKNLKEIDDQGIFPLDSLDHYNAKSFCDLNQFQLVLFNIPLNVQEQQIRQFVNEITGETVQVEIHRCSINLNAAATITFDKLAEPFKTQLDQSRFNEILIEAKSQLDSGNEGKWDRTIVVTNLDRSLSFQQVLHKLADYGRVINAVIPLEQVNPDLPFLEDVQEKYKNSFQNPVKLEIFNVETRQTQILLYPPKEKFFENYKEPDQSLKVDQDIFQQQESIKEHDQYLALYKFLADRTIKCLKVPERLKDKYRKIWLPHINQTPLDSINYDLYAKSYQNRGYALATFPSKAMAQRALLAINQRGSTDLSELPLKLINNPEFFQENFSHSKQEIYGGKFRIENFMGQQLKALKTWDDIELYQVDLVYNLQKLEEVRKDISRVRDEVVEQKIEIDDWDTEKDRKEQMRQKIYKELNMDNKFKEFVEDKSFSKTLDQFEQNFKAQPSDQKGRQFELDIATEHYHKILKSFEDQSSSIKAVEKEYADKIADQNQRKYLKNYHEEQILKKVTGESDDLLHYLKQRLVKEHYQNLDQAQKLPDEMQGFLEKANMKLQDREASIINQKNLYQASEDREKFVQKQKIKGFKFSTLITNPQYIRKQRYDKHDQFLNYLKRLILGEYDPYDNMPLVAVHPYLNADPIRLTLERAQDSNGQPYITEATIQQIRKYDIPINGEEKIQKQLQNRKKIISLLPQDYLQKLKIFVKQSTGQQAAAIVKVPTETFELEDGQDLNETLNNLNKYVAVQGEEYVSQIDPLTEKQYIVKTESPYFKYDVSFIKGRNIQEDNAKMINILTQKYQIKKERAEEIVEQLVSGKSMPQEFKEIIRKVSLNLQRLKQEDESEWLEDFLKNSSMTRKEYESIKDLNYNNLDEIMAQMGQQKYIKTQQLMQQPVNYDSKVRENDGRGIKIKDQKGNYIIPKAKRF